QTMEQPLVATGVAEMIGLQRGSVTSEDAFWAVRSFLEARAKERPLVVVFDDVHWAEPAFLDLIEHVADWSRDAPILLLCVARPGRAGLRGGQGVPSWRRGAALTRPGSVRGGRPAPGPHPQGADPAGPGLVRGRGRLPLPAPVDPGRRVPGDAQGGARGAAPA